MTDGVKALGSIHDRMPVILSPEGVRLWLDSDVTDAAQLKPLLAPHAPPELEAYRVSTRVNNARTEAPDLVQPAPHS